LISVAGPSAITRPRHHHDPVCVGVGFLEMVRREDDGLPALRDGAHRLPEIATCLEHATDAALCDRFGWRAAEQPDGAGIRPGEAEHHVDRRRLAGTVRAEDRDGLARRDCKVDAAHRLDGSAGLAQTSEDDAVSGWTIKAHASSIVVLLSSR
jgi:hypothetical protein